MTVIKTTKKQGWWKRKIVYESNVLEAIKALPILEK